MKRSNQGFTLIELIIVIVILGILAVTASPKFLDLTGDARVSTVNGLAGSVTGGANVIYSKSIIEGEATDNKAAESDVDSILTVFGYPTAQDINEAIDLSTEWTIKLNHGTPASATSAIIFPSGVDNGAQAALTVADGAVTDDDVDQCYVIYTESAASGSAPSVQSVTGGCS